MLRPILILAALILLAPSVAKAQSCSFNVTGINFGTVDTLSGAAVDVTGTVNVTCSIPLLGLLSHFRTCININAGSGGATGTTRHMRNASNTPLNYGIYKDAARSIPWGSSQATMLGTPVTIDFLNLLGSRTESRTIYARVFGGQQNAPAGAYTSVFSGGEIILYYDTSTLLPTNTCASITESQDISTLTVTANVADNCSVTAQDIDFGNHGVLSSLVDATGGVGITCTPGTSYAVGLNNGLNGDGPTQRRMALGGEAVVYGLYKDVERSQPWGGSGGGLMAGTGAGTTQNIPVYARVPAQQTPSPGTYTDTVVVTVTY